ncbi:SpoIIE family protein phosphatase [Streptomyces sp. MS1.AVA.1]|uniref:SpoIIE family protein phosphatase n=1 Tax=Streptomyces machairae TaxID=3134109 RepID=A0ABU8UWI8_9ACTN
MGLGLAAAYAASGTIAWAPGDLVLLCTDGVLEAQKPGGHLYPLLDRIRSWPGGGPGSLVSFLRSDLLRYTGGGRLDDDAALVAFRLAR